MSNFNDKIAEYTGDGIPAYNRKINEIVKKLNWLMGMRSINGKPITESDQGPVFDLSPVNTSQGAQPWLTDPAGNRAGWSKVKVFDPTGLMFFDVYAWTGALLAQEDAPWLFDPSNKQAGWIVCPDNSFWGTGQCHSGATCTNFQNAVVDSSSPDNTTSPVWISYGPASPPITPPSSCTPRFYLVADDYAIAQPGSPHQPCFYTSPTLITGDPSSTLTYDYSITYDGTQIFHVSGTTLITNPGSIGGIIPIDPAGWLYDPGGIPGYAQGSKSWIFPFNGAASPNTNPQIRHTYTYGFLRLSGIVFLTTVFMTG